MVEMAMNSTTFLRQERTLQGFTTGLVSAICEWFLIFLLLIDAVLSYLLTQFSIYCELPVPCIFCSRLDHVLGREKPGFYRNLFCTNHKSEISSLVSCEIHGKLVDGRGMCENCVSSSIKKNTLNSNIHKLLLGRIGFGHGSHEAYSFQNSFYKGKHTRPYQSPRMCLCCNELWTPKPALQSSLQLKPFASYVNKPNIPLPRHLSRRNSLKKMKDKMSSRGSSRRCGKKSFDLLSHVGYTELKINSEPESEFPFTDDDDISSVVPDFSDKEESLVHYFATGVQPKKVDKMIVSNMNENPEAKHLAHTAAEEIVLSKIKPHQTVFKTNNTGFAEFVSLDGIPSSSSNLQVFIDGSYLSQNSYNPGLSDFLSFVHSSPIINFTEVPQASEKMSADNAETSNKYSTCSRTNLETNQAVNNPVEIDSTCGNPSDMHKVDTSDEVKDGFERIAEQPDMKYEQTDEDTKSKKGKCFLGKEAHSLGNNSSQAFQVQGNELDKIDRSYSNGAQNTYASVSPDRADLSFESFDISSVSEVEGENVVDRLRRQVQHDWKCIKVLHKELEEERSAVAIAANQALAMISKLQEEKAALQMEAHQYLRMMEEQSEHDAMELEKANDLVAEKENDIQDLEAELDYYRIKYGDDLVMDENVSVENISHPNNVDGLHVHEMEAEMVPSKSSDLEENVSSQNINASHEQLEPIKVRSNHLEEKAPVERKSVSFKKDEVHVSGKPTITDRSIDSEKPVAIPTRSEIEEEKTNILLRLKSLEKKFHQVMNSSSPHTPNSVSYTEVVEERHQKGEITDETGEIRCVVVKNSPSQKLQGVESTTTISSEEGLKTSGNDGSDHLVSSSGEQHDDDCLHDLVTIQNEISELNHRFEALESKYNFRNHPSNSSQNENEGRKFIREMDLQLRQLRRLVSMKKF